MRPEEVVERFYVAIAREAPHVQPPGTVSVTSLCFPCARRSVIELLTGGERAMDPASLIRVWVGKMCHQTRVLGAGAEKELELQWEGIYGRVDEYDPATGTLLDIKTTRSVPQSPREHHVRQVEYYAVLLAKSGRPVGEAFILYADVDSAYVKVYPVPLRPLEEVEREMLEKKNRILECARAGVLPPREVSFWEEGGRRTVCEYCGVTSLCLASDLTLVRGARWGEE